KHYVFISPPYAYPAMLSFFMLLRPPTPTLFPYTTLFRSQLPVGGQGADACIDLLRTDLQRAQVVRDGQAVASEAGDPHVVLDQQDRKSTRLNSSHVSISYAVFCLKKKKKLYNILLL